jgi:hypothetical protein
MRGVYAALAVVLALNGLDMLFRGEAWYRSIPSVPHTGPYNPHFVMDIGCAYLGSAFGLALAAWRPAWSVPAAAVAVFFLAAHALVHMAEAIGGHASAAHAGLVDIVGVYGPPLVILAMLVVTMHRVRRVQGVS